MVFAVSVNVRDRNRFAGKPYVESPVKRGIDEPETMLNKTLAEAENPNGKRVAAATSTADDLYADTLVAHENNRESLQLPTEFHRVRVQ